MMQLLPKGIEDYALAHSGAEEPLLRELSQKTHAQMPSPQMLSGHLQGRLLYLLVKLSRAKNALEIGMFTGYSAICMARGLQEGGMLTCLERDESCIAMAKSFIARSEVKEKIRILPGNALETMKQLQGDLDFVFLDADKTNYANYYEFALPKMPAGALLVADNVLWSGKVMEDEKRMDGDTRALARFNEMVRQDPRVETLLLPVRDGLMLIRKK